MTFVHRTDLFGEFGSPVFAAREKTFEFTLSIRGVHAQIVCHPLHSVVTLRGTELFEVGFDLDSV